jgi:hypothetical protein
MRDRQKLGIEMVARWMTRRRGIDPDAKVYYRLHKDGTRSRIDERDPKEYDGVVSAWVWYGLYEATELVSVYNAAVTAGDDPVPETLTGIRQLWRVHHIPSTGICWRRARITPAYSVFSWRCTT